MNEIEVKRWEKKLTSKGVSKKLANEIVATAWKSGKGELGRFVNYIDYALVLTYGTNLIKASKCNV